MYAQRFVDIELEEALKRATGVEKAEEYNFQAYIKDLRLIFNSLKTYTSEYKIKLIPEVKDSTFPIRYRGHQFIIGETNEQGMRCLYMQEIGEDKIAEGSEYSFINISDVIDWYRGKTLVK